MPTAPSSPIPLRTAELDYELPDSAIATTPAEPRDSAKLLVCHRAADTVNHTHVSELASFLQPGDLLVLNNTRVAPSRFLGHRPDSHGKVEGLIISPGPAPAVFRAMLRMRRQKPGVEVVLHDRHGGDSGLRLRLLERTSEDDGAWLVQLIDAANPPHPGDATPAANPSTLWDHVGLTPLPPYILAARRQRGDNIPDDLDREHYQTVFAESVPPDQGSIAAPTAGLHLTPELLSALRALNIRTANVTLHVGIGTFKPVETEFVHDHPMHTEWCRVPADTARALADARSNNHRIIAVGTTTARTLESFESPADMLARGERGIDTRILITPGYRFRHVDALLTNFHLPRSTLMAMVAAFLQDRGADAPPHHAGVPRLLALYHEALSHHYRFYSFGDAMLILP